MKDKIRELYKKQLNIRKKLKNIRKSMGEMEAECTGQLGDITDNICKLMDTKLATNIFWLDHICKDNWGLIFNRKPINVEIHINNKKHKLDIVGVHSFRLPELYVLIPPTQQERNNIKAYRWVSFEFKNIIQAYNGINLQ